MESGNSLVFLQGTKNIVRIEEVFELQGFQVMESENNLQGTKILFELMRFSNYKVFKLWRVKITFKGPKILFELMRFSITRFSSYGE